MQKFNKNEAWIFNTLQLYRNDRVDHLEMLLKLATEKKILDALRELFHGDFFPFQTLNFEKGTQQRLHSDWFHFAPSNNKGLAGVCTDPPSFIIITVKTDIAAGHIVGDYGV